ncbi:MAG: tetratricopeptide repeat protein [Hyphomonadaceae bacterium]
MRAKWLAAAAASAWLVAGSTAPAPQSGSAASLFAFVSSDLCSPAGARAQQALLASFLGVAEAYAQTLPGSPDAPPPLMQGLGDAHMAITTQNPQAQAYFDQGVRFLHAFNHAEAVRAFKQAQRLDPDCGMCFWGEAFALGPNINAPMEMTDAPAAYAAMRAAQARASNASPAERALIEALQTRYVETPGDNRSALDSAFADAMIAAAEAHPDNDLVQILAAEAVMDTQPWDYWEADQRTPKGRAGDAIERVETVLARSPNNAGAIHLHIHLVEASFDPWRAEPGAERLARAAPQAGHLVHMPGHIFYRIGRFRESIRTNIDAVNADESYIDAFSPSPIYRYGYYPHNLHFVMTSALMGGDARTALDYAERLDASIPIEMAAAVPLAQPVKAAPWFARAQFAPPESVLAAAAPEEGVSYVTGAWRFARGIANARLGRFDAALAEAQEIQNLIDNGDFSVMTNSGVPAPALLAVYRHIVLGRAHMMQRNYDDAIRELQAAADGQRAIPYTEPPYVFYPVRRTLGAAYLMNGQPAVAEMEFLQTLIESPNDAYAYWGLSEARRMRGDRRGANAARQLFNAAFLGPRNSVALTSL